MTSHREGACVQTVSANDKSTQQTNRGGRFSLVTQKRHILPPTLTAAHANVSEGTKVTFTSSEKDENERVMGWGGVWKGENSVFPLLML